MTGVVLLVVVVISLNMDTTLAIVVDLVAAVDLFPIEIVTQE